MFKPHTYYYHLVIKSIEKTLEDSSLSNPMRSNYEHILQRLNEKKIETEYYNPKEFLSE